MTFLELLREYGVDLRQGGESPHVSQGWIGCICPWCGAGTGKYGLGFNLSSGACKCWKCGPHGQVEAVTELTGLPWGAVKALLDGVDRELPPPPVRGKLKLPAGAGPLLPAHRRYLRGRGIDPDEAAGLWHVQGIGMAARLAWRLLLPVEAGGKAVSWTTRAIGSGQPRYVAAGAHEEACPAKSVLYGADLARHAVVVVEGPLDAMRVGPGAVATLGVGFTRAQLLRLSRYPSRCICFDSEPVAQLRAARLCEALAAFPGATTRCELDAADPGSASEREIKRLRRAFL